VRAIASAKVIEAPIALSKEMCEADRQRGRLGRSEEDERAFYDALEG